METNGELHRPTGAYVEAWRHVAMCGFVVFSYFGVMPLMTYGLQRFIGHFPSRHTNIPL